MFSLIISSKCGKIHERNCLNMLYKNSKYINMSLG